MICSFLTIQKAQKDEAVQNDGSYMLFLSLQNIRFSVNFNSSSRLQGFGVGLGGVLVLCVPSLLLGVRGVLSSSYYFVCF